MSRKPYIIFAALLLAMPVGAQAQGARAQAPAARGPLANTAEFLLSQTARLELSDQQTLRLAELARESEALQEQMRSQRQALRPETRPQADEERSAMRASMRQLMQENQAQLEEQRTEAIAVLTPEQQAQAWEMLARRGPRDRPAAMMGQRGDRQRPGARARPMGPRGNPAPVQTPAPEPQG